METKEFQRWTAKRKVELLLQLIRGERKLVDVCREHDLKQSEVDGWMDTFVKGGERSLKARAEDEQAVHEAEVRELRAMAALRQQRPASNPVTAGQKSLARQGRRGRHYAPQRASARSSGECRLGIGLAPGNTANVYVAPSLNVRRLPRCRRVARGESTSKDAGTSANVVACVSSARCIMFAMSACHGTRRQVVEQGRRSPARPAPHWEQAVGRAFFGRGGSRVIESDRRCERWLSARSRVS
jgi:transposase-like protein